MKKKLSLRVPEVHRKHVATFEDWSPSLEPLAKHGLGDTKWCNPLTEPAVCVTCAEQIPFTGKYHLSVWGGDDTGMDMWDLSREEAFTLYHLIDNYVTKKELRSLGLNYV